MRPVDALRVGDQEGQPRVFDGVVDLRFGPPGIERHGDGADGQDGREGHHPLGEVAHGDADPVPLVDPEGVHEGVSQGIDMTHRLVKGPALVLVDHERGRDPPGPGEHLTERGGRVLEQADVDAVDHPVGQLEHLTGRGDLGVGLVVAERHRRHLSGP